MKYLLLGGAGFIGTHLATKLINDGHHVTVLDSLATSTGTGLPPSVQFIKGDIASFDIEPLIATHDIVYFLAGSVGVLKVIWNPQVTLTNNIAIAMKLIPILEKYNKRVIFSSTSEVYGNGPFVEAGNLSIGAPTELRWSYAAAKLTTEFMLTAANCPSTIVRFFNVVGPGQLGEYGMVLPRFIAAAQANMDIEVYDNGNQTRSFCHVQDAVSMLQQLEDAPLGIYNVGSYNVATVNQLAERIIALSQSSSTIRHAPLPCTDIHSRIPDLTKLHNTIGNLTSYTLDGIIWSML